MGFWGFGVWGGGRCVLWSLAAVGVVCLRVGAGPLGRVPGWLARVKGDGRRSLLRAGAGPSGYLAIARRWGRRKSDPSRGLVRDPFGAPGHCSHPCRVTRPCSRPCPLSTRPCPDGSRWAPGGFLFSRLVRGPLGTWPLPQGGDSRKSDPSWEAGAGPPWGTWPLPTPHRITRPCSRPCPLSTRPCSGGCRGAPGGCSHFRLVRSPHGHLAIA